MQGTKVKILGPSLKGKEGWIVVEDSNPAKIVFPYIFKTYEDSCKFSSDPKMDYYDLLVTSLSEEKKSKSK